MFLVEPDGRAVDGGQRRLVDLDSRNEVYRSDRPAIRPSVELFPWAQDSSEGLRCFLQARGRLGLSRAERPLVGLAVTGFAAPGSKGERLCATLA